jgi:hypothetical protein
MVVFTAEVVAAINKNADRVAELGNWPEHMRSSAAAILLSRVPTDTQKAPGYDAGIGCCIGTIPRDKQRLAATLHAAYTPEAITQIMVEMIRGYLNPDSELTWWLASCALCKEEGVDVPTFMNQIEAAYNIAYSDVDRVELAKKELELMKKRCELVTFTTDDEKEYIVVPAGRLDGAIQAAYLRGFRWGTWIDGNSGLYFIGTYLETLGLEDFNWSDMKDKEGRSKSGPVHGSRQFVKCATESEFILACLHIMKKIGKP